MTEKQLKAMARATGELIRDVLAPYVKRIEALEAQSAEFGYKGVWRAGKTFQRGNFVTDHSSLWHCERETTSRPGEDDSWRLAVKRGQHS